jgi:ATP-dependent DNA helicase RecG
MHVLDQSLDTVISLRPYQKLALEKARITSVRDFLMVLPTAYVNSVPNTIASLTPGVYTMVSGSIKKLTTKKMFPKHTAYTEAVISDGSRSIRAIWFTHISTARFSVNDTVHITGKVHKNKRGIFFANPSIEKKSESDTDYVVTEEATISPVYPRIRGISLPVMQEWRDKIFSSLPPNLSDPLPLFIRTKCNLPSLTQTLQYAHAPPTTAWATAARKRFAFEEMFTIQLHRLRMRRMHARIKTHAIPSINSLKDIITTLPFPLTNAQKRATKDILHDIARPNPMARLLEGDVGSGKTLVAIITTLATVRAGFQVAYLAPTEILARQHFAEFCNRLAPFKTSIGLITSAECKSYPSKINRGESVHISRNQLLTWARDGKLPVLIGTHALLEKRVAFKNLALAIIDEQHRFGIQQRGRLSEEHHTPHLLSMTATPIPRTLALTLYGDLDISLLNEMPSGRKKPITRIVPPQKRAEAYEFIRKNINTGGQAFVICPKIDNNKNTTSLINEVKSVTDEYERLQKEIFPERTVAMLHGRLKPKEKEEIIRLFREKKIHILVSTSVIEVGMDIPNASIIMIEGAERFGLASLHQFRGRVGRAGQQAYCFVFSESRNPKTLERLTALVKAKNGFELAEYDLQLRGAGELSGTSQWGITDLGMEALQNIKMVEVAREEAKKLIEEDPELATHPELKERVQKLEEKGIHLE